MRLPSPQLDQGRPALRPWKGGAVFGPRHLLGAGALAAAVLAASAPDAAAQVFEVSDGGMRQVSAEAPQPAPKTTPKTTPAGSDRLAEIATVAARYQLAPELLDTVAQRESGYRTDAVSKAGAVGVMQLMPATARALHVDPHDPAANLDGGAAYLRRLLDRFDARIDLALAAYNAGPGAVERHAGVPPYRETRAYITANLDQLAERSFADPFVSTTVLVHESHQDPSRRRLAQPRHAQARDGGRTGRGRPDPQRRHLDAGHPAR